MNRTNSVTWAPQRYFFDQGLRFACTRCGQCCTGAPGIVFLTPEALAPLAEYLGLTEADTIRRYLAPWRDGHTVREDADGRCLFYKEGCTIYPVRPAQCRSWPFWLANLRSRERWERAAKSCPGIGRGRHYSREEILNLLSPP
ncbi:MAG: YkgJ family cysteine cluster protein [Desulfosarcinaceae bacterium]|jgi:Fe-S-cluster containining protein